MSSETTTNETPLAAGLRAAVEIAEWRRAAPKQVSGSERIDPVGKAFLAGIEEVLVFLRGALGRAERGEDHRQLSTVAAPAPQPAAPPEPRVDPARQAEPRPDGVRTAVEPAEPAHSRPDAKDVARNIWNQTIGKKIGMELPSDPHPGDVRYYAGPIVETRQFVWRAKAGRVECRRIVGMVTWFRSNGYASLADIADALDQCELVELDESAALALLTR